MPASFILTDSNNQNWAVTVNTDGSLQATETSVAATGPLVLVDPNGQAWAVAVNTDGTLQLTETTAAAVVPSALSTVTVQSVINYCMTHTELMPLANVAGYTDEPALSLANDTLQEILAPPFAWKFNRATMPLLLTQQNRQDYKFAGAAAFTLKGASVIGGVGIALSSTGAISQDVSGTVTVRTLDPHNFSVGDLVYMVGNIMSAYNSVETITPSGSNWSGGWVVTAVVDNRTFQFVHGTTGLPGSGAPGIADFGWGESATFVDENETSSPRHVRYLEVVRSLQPVSLTGIPSKVTVSESGTPGVLTVRFDCVPSSAAYGVTLMYQKKAPVLTAIAGSTWSPVPDEFAFVIRQMFLAQAFRYVGSAREAAEFQKSQIAMQKALGRDDAEASEEFIAPEHPLMGWF